MLQVVVLTILLVAVLKSGFAASVQSSVDSRSLSREELLTFLPLVCLKPAPMPQSNALVGHPNFSCRRLIGYRDASRADIALSAIAYGPFTGPRADESYISYLSNHEPHVNDNGGGILFRRSGKHWQLVRWYPGRAMRNCLALPVERQQRMLCLSSHTGQGEIDTSVWIEEVGSKSTADQQSVIKAQDDRGRLDPDEANSASYPCLLGGRTHKAMLLSIDSLIRSNVDTELARSAITYATADDVGAACSSGHFERVKTKTGIVHYLIKDGSVVIKVPIQFAKTDY